MSKLNILGINFDNIDENEALLITEELIKKDVASLVVTPNAEIGLACINDEHICKIINSADLILPDGVGVLEAAKIISSPLKKKIAGVDYGESVCRMCADLGKKLYLLGGKPGVAEKAAEKLCEKYKGLTVVGTHDGYFEKSGKESDEIVSDINKTGADVLFVCLGFPCQEIWASENRYSLSEIKLIACLGGSLDVYSGSVKRAPAFFIKLRLEWFYRLLKEPRRFKRMLSLPEYIKKAKQLRKEMRKKQ